MATDSIKTRIYDTLIINGEPLVTLFDTGAWNTYLTQPAAQRCGLIPLKLDKPLKMALGGKHWVVREYVVLQGSLQGLPLDLYTLLIDDLGRNDDGKSLDVLFGLLAMERWGVQPDVRRKRIDLSRYPTEFTEYPAA